MPLLPMHLRRNGRVNLAPTEGYFAPLLTSNEASSLVPNRSPLSCTSVRRRMHFDQGTIQSEVAGIYSGR